MSVFRTTVLCVASLFVFQLSVPSARGDSAFAEFKASPAFSSCGLLVKTDSPVDGLPVEYRKLGDGGWLKAMPLVYDKAKGESRGSIAGLDEDSVYQFKAGPVSGSFKTWSSTPKIARTVTLDPARLSSPLTISDQGSADAWTLYKAAPGAILKCSDAERPAILFKSAKFVVLDGLSIEGGGFHSVQISESENVRILNCEISGWGPTGKQGFDKDGKYFAPDGKHINNCAGVFIDRSLNVVVERCYIHDPRGRANSWKFSHPAGPNAIFVRSLGGTVLRYNDFIGSDPHRWNDVVEGWGNGHPDGGFFRDAEICGNMLAFGNDDGIELDGGQINVRFFKNKIEGCFAGVSTAPCLGGPSYVFQNLIVRLSDDAGRSGSAFKNNYGEHGGGRVCFLSNSVVSRASSGFSDYGPDPDKAPSPFIGQLKGFMRNNVVSCGKGAIASNVFKWRNDFDGDLLHCDPLAEGELRQRLAKAALEEHGLFDNPEFLDAEGGDFRLKTASPGSAASLEVQGFCARGADLGAFPGGVSSEPLPYRPLPVVASPQSLEFKASKDGSYSEREVVVSCLDKSFKGAFSIRKNSSFDWFEAIPASSKLDVANPAVRIKVRILKERLEGPWIHRGLFLVRFENGLSRPVSVYANSDLEPKPALPSFGFNSLLRAENAEGSGAFALEKGEDGVSCVALEGPLESQGGRGLLFKFEVPENGDYMLFAKLKSDYPVTSHDSFFVSIDGSAPLRADLRSSLDWTWAQVSRNGISNIELLKLAKGVHAVKISPREPLKLEALLLTNAFEAMLNPRGY